MPDEIRRAVRSGCAVSYLKLQPGLGRGGSPGTRVSAFVCQITGAVVDPDVDLIHRLRFKPGPVEDELPLIRIVLCQSIQSVHPDGGACVVDTRQTVRNTYRNNPVASQISLDGGSPCAWRRFVITKLKPLLLIHPGSENGPVLAPSPIAVRIGSFTVCMETS